MDLIREYIRLILEKEILGEPDESAEDDREEESHHDEQAMGGVPGPAMPLGVKSPAYPADDPRKKKSTDPRKKKYKK